MKVDFRLLGSHLATLGWVGLRSFLGTLLLFTAAGIVLAGLSYSFLREQHWIYAAIAVAVALAEAVATGVALGIKRAIAMTVIHALGTLGLGRSLVRLVFERMLGVIEPNEPGSRGGRIAQELQRLPLAQAEQLLSRAIGSLEAEAESDRGWLRRKIQARLLGAVRTYTLARFRQEGASHGSIDLWKVKEELEHTLDQALVQKVRGGLRLWTLLAVIGLPLVVAVQTYLLIMLLHAKG